MKFKSRRRSGAGRKGSPAKGRSPFKRRSISRTKPVAGALDLEQVTEDSGSKGSSGPVQANIRVAVRVRPENERELASCYRWAFWYNFLSQRIPIWHKRQSYSKSFLIINFNFQRWSSIRIRSTCIWKVGTPWMKKGPAILFAIFSWNQFLKNQNLRFSFPSPELKLFSVKLRVIFNLAITSANIGPWSKIISTFKDKYLTYWFILLVAKFNFSFYASKNE